LADKLRKLVRNAERSPPYFLMINFLIYCWTMEFVFYILDMFQTYLVQLGFCSTMVDTPFSYRNRRTIVEFFRLRS
jgi:hypothetical protein